MNIIKTKVNFEKRTCLVSGINLTSGDYNSTKMEFTFDREDGTKVLEMINPSGRLVYLGEIRNDEVVLVGKADITTVHENVTYIKYLDSSENIYWYDKESDKLYDSNWQEIVSFDLGNYTKQTKDCSLFTEEGNYVFEISLYDGDSKLTSAFNKLKVLPQQVSVDDEVAEVYLPIFDEMLSDLSGAINEVDNLDISMTKSGTTATITITKKDGTQETKNIYDGEKGDTGPYYTPSVDDSGNISWTNNGGLVNPTTKNIKGPKGDPGATGSDGVSPVANVTKNGSTATISVTDKNGTTSVNVSDGTNGQDGYSPTATISKNGSTATISITDKNGTTTANISDGEDGETGATGPAGQDGFSPTATVTQTQSGATISITDKNGTTTADITNGEDGEVTQTDFDYFKKIENALIKVTGSGEGIILNDTAECPLKVELKGNTSQFSTTGKNLWGGFTYSKTASGITFTHNINGSIIATGTATDNIDSILSSVASSNGYYKTLEAGTYIMSGGTANVLISAVKTNGVTLATTTATIFSKTITLTETTNVFIRARVNNGTAVNETVYVMLESGSSVTSYEPYTNGASPNPSYPQDIHVVTGNNTINVNNKNLFNKDDTNITNNRYLKEDGLEEINNSWCYTDYIPINPGTSYTTSGMTIGNAPSCCYYDKNKNFISGVRHGSNSVTEFTNTSPNNAYYIRESVRQSDLSNVMIEANTQATSYIPYGRTTYLISLGTLELCKIGNYEDYIYKSGGKWYKYCAVGKRTDTSGSTGITINDMVSNGAIYSYYGGTVSGTTISYDSAISGTNTIYYQLATATTQEITDSTLVSQLNALEYAISYQDQTNISQTNDDKPFIINASAFADMNIIISNLTNAIIELGGE